MNEFRSTERPLGISIIATLMMVFAILGLCGSLAAFGFAPLAVFGRGGLGAVFATGFGGLIGLVLAVANLILAAGLFRLQSWAYWATIIIEVLSLFNAGIAGDLGVPRVGCGVHLIPLIVIIYMLVDQNVRRAFRV
jgi:hypothetical protein